MPQPDSQAKPQLSIPALSFEAVQRAGSGAIENRGPNPGHVPLIAPGFILRRDFGVFAQARSIP